MALKLITPPDGYPVTLDQVKTHVHAEDFTDDDAILLLYLQAAVGSIDGWWGTLNKALKPQTWELTYDEFPDAIQIPLGPLISVESIKYDDVDGNEQTIDPADYVVDTVVENGWIIPVADFEWPALLDRVNAVRVRFIAGWPDEPDTSSGAASGAVVSTVPAKIKAAILLMVGHIYENREQVSADMVLNGKEGLAMPMTVKALLRGYTPLLIA